MESHLKARIIVCEFSDPLFERLQFTKFLMQVGEATHLFECSWLLQSVLTCDELLDHCKPMVGPLDNLLILNADSNICWHTTDDICSEILQKLKN